MTESSLQNPSSPNITLKEERDSQERPESPNPFLPADQVEFMFDEITFSTNNEVALLYPSHPKSEYFEIVSDFISKCCLKKAFTRAANHYVEYLVEFWYTAKALEHSKIWVSTPIGGIRGEIGITTFRNALRAYYLPHSSQYVTPLSLGVVRPRFATIGYSGEIQAKGTLKKSFLPLRWRLLMTQIIQCLGGKTGRHDQISNKDAIIFYCLANGVEVDLARLIWEDIIHKLNKKIREKVIPHPRFIYLLSKYMMPEYDHEDLTINPTQVFNVHNWALKPNQHEGPPFTDHMKAICNTDVPTKASKSKTGQLDKETQSSSAKDKSSSHPSASTLMVSKVHKEAQQAAGGLASLGATSKEGAHPQLSSDKTKSARDGLKSAHTDLGTNKESRSDEVTKKIKLEDLSNLMQDTRSSFFTPDSLVDKPIIVSYESKDEETKRYEDTHATSHDEPEDTSKLKLEQQKEKAEDEVAFLKAQPLYPDVNQLTELLVTSLKLELSRLLASHDFASCLPTELKELPSKITELFGEVKELKKHVAELKTLQWELPAEFLGLPSQISSVQENLKTLDALPSLLNKVTDTLNRFATIVENTSSKATNKSVPSAGQANASPAEGEKNTKDADNANLKQQTTTTTPPTTS
ncbi:hypothetical protein Tco_1327519 [Tanacetum coccineum]